jgi:hypothetical protein
MNGLLDVTCKRVANMIKEKAPEEIHRMFNIRNDFTPQEVRSIHFFLFICMLQIYNIAGGANSKRK